MLAPILLSLGTILLAPLSPDGAPPASAPPARPPIVLAVDASDSAMPGDFDTALAGERVIEGLAARLRARGVRVRTDGGRAFLVGPAVEGPAAPTPSQGGDATSNGALTLSVGFGAGTSRWPSGTETRFGGEGDAAWRLASLVQKHVVGGLRDVLDYPDFDRGVVEQENPDQPGRPRTLQPGDSWVSTYPLFATNPDERALLQWPDTFDLVSSALADAVTDYLDPNLETLPRTPEAGWRTSASWQPVSPKVIDRAANSTKLALTFDGGGPSAPTLAILKALREAGVRATVFLTADWVRQNPGLVIQIARDGHEIGNHSSTHPDMTKLSTPDIISQLSNLENAVEALTGRTTRPWFRPPFGSHDKRLVQVAADQGYYAIMWTADSADWRDDIAPATVQRRLLTYAAPGAILIEHLGSPQSAQVLPEVLSLLKQRGFTFGTLSEVLGTVD